MSSLSNALTLIKNDLEVDFIPVIIGALQTLQKSPGVGGALAAEAYLLGNAPAALIGAEVQLLQEGIQDLGNKLASLTAAKTAPAPATTATLAK
jgi:hypothetical protein